MLTLLKSSRPLEHLIILMIYACHSSHICLCHLCIHRSHICLGREWEQPQAQHQRSACHSSHNIRKGGSSRTEDQLRPQTQPQQSACHSSHICLCHLCIHHSHICLGREREQPRAQHQRSACHSSHNIHRGGSSRTEDRLRPQA